MWGLLFVTKTSSFFPYNTCCLQENFHFKFTLQVRNLSQSTLTLMKLCNTMVNKGIIIPFPLKITHMFVYSQHKEAAIVNPISSVGYRTNSSDSCV